MPCDTSRTAPPARGRTEFRLGLPGSTDAPFVDLLIDRLGIAPDAHTVHTGARLLYHRVHHGANTQQTRSQTCRDARCEAEGQEAQHCR